MSYVYIQSECPSADTDGLWTAGFYTPDGRWEPDSDWGSREQAAQRVNYLNGAPDEQADAARIQRLLQERSELLGTLDFVANAYEGSPPNERTMGFYEARNRARAAIAAATQE